jgi:hypothetical protein
MIMKRQVLAFVLGAACLGASGPAFTHHSFAMFDREQSVTITGTVKEFQWTNPHAWILLMVPNAGGQLDQYAIEMGGPGALQRQGWSPTTLGPGMAVKVAIHPLRDGSKGGQFVSLTLPDGTQIGDRPGRAAPTPL